MSLRILSSGFIGMVVVLLSCSRTAHADDGGTAATAKLVIHGGIAVTAVGGALVTGGLAVMLSNLGPSYERLSLCEGDAACEASYHRAAASADARSAPGRVVASVGLVTALVGGLAIFVGALVNGSSSHRVRRTSLLVGRF